MADNAREDNELEQQITQKGAGFIKKVGGKVGEFAGKAIDKLIPKGVKFKFRIFVLSVSLIFIVGAFLLLLVYGGWVKLTDALKKIFSGDFGTFDLTINTELYDSTPITEWRNGGDPDMTFQVWQALKKEYEHKYNSGDAYDHASMNSSLSDDELDDSIRTLSVALDYDNTYLDPSDIVKILEFASNENEKMFAYRSIWYKKQIWSIGLHDNAYTDEVTGEYHAKTSEWYEWDMNDSTATNTSDDLKYGLLTSENVRGEEFDGQKIYTVHWQDVLALAYFYTLENYEDWGTFEDTDYDSNVVRTDENGLIHRVNSLTNYFFKGNRLKQIEDLFKYDFNYYYAGPDNSDGHGDTGHNTEATAYTFNDFVSGNNKIGYRYKRYDLKSYHSSDIYDPTNTPSKLKNPKKTYENNPEYEPLTTEFVPEAAPLSVHNKIESYVYFYIPTDEVTGYNVDPDNFEAPQGNYCVGKWKIVDPTPFIDELLVLAKRFKINDTAYAREHYNYTAASELMKNYVYFLEVLEQQGVCTGRADYYKSLVELYDNNEIEVYYYGMKASDEAMTSYLEKIIEMYPGKSIKVLDYSNAHDYGDFYEISETDVKLQAKAGTLPFPSYGVTYYTGDGSVQDNQSGNIPVDENYVGDFYVSEHGEYHVDGWAHLQEGADESLDSGHYYTREQIAAAVSLLKIKGNSYTYSEGIHAGETYVFNWSECIDDLYEYNSDTGVDVIALLAICYTEYTPKVGYPTWNWFNLTTGSGTVFRRSSSDSFAWWNVKADTADWASQGYHTQEGCCMVTCMKSIVSRYWTNPNRRQNSYFKMSWNRYGWDLTGEYLPQDWDSAVAAEAQMESVGHCYCPWWQDGYVTHGYDSFYLWCNTCARNRARMLRGIGGGGADEPETHEIIFVGDSRTVCMFSSTGSATISGDKHDDIRVYAKWGADYSYLVSAVSSAGDFDVLAIWLGCNDAAQGKKFLNDYAGYLEVLLAQGKQIVIFNVGRTEDDYLKAGDEGYVNPNMIAFNDSIYSWAHGRGNVQYVDIYPKSLSWALNTSDGIHYAPRPTTGIWNTLKAYLH